MQFYISRDNGAMTWDQGVEALAAALGTPASENLRNALTTQAADRHNNLERLEILGDALMRFIVVDLLWRHPKLQGIPPGAINSMRVAIEAEREAIAPFMRSTGIATLIRTGQPGTPPGTQTLIDVCEAMLAAIYLDSGLVAAYNFVRNGLAARIKECIASRGASASDPDPEAFQKLHLHLGSQPRNRYYFTEHQGTDRLWSVDLIVDNRKVSSAIHPLKKAAQQLAITKYLTGKP